jgi:hypothetical protein
MEKVRKARIEARESQDGTIKLLHWRKAFLVLMLES